jgi:hypothetical protein
VGEAYGKNTVLFGEGMKGIAVVFQEEELLL